MDPYSYFDIDNDERDEFGLKNADYRNIQSSEDIVVADPGKNLIDYVRAVQPKATKLIELIADSAANGEAMHSLLIGEPGIGKSLLGKALAQEISKKNKKLKNKYEGNLKDLESIVNESLKWFEGDSAVSSSAEYSSRLKETYQKIIDEYGLCDIICLENKSRLSRPFVRFLPPGTGEEYCSMIERNIRKKQLRNKRIVQGGLGTYYAGIGALALSVAYNLLSNGFNPIQNAGNSLFTLSAVGAVVSAAIMPLLLYVFWYRIMGTMGGKTPKNLAPTPLVTQKAGIAPFKDITGAGPKAILGDIRHDPYQSGGLETPAHSRVEAGYVHEANKGVLFIDEIKSVLGRDSYDDKFGGSLLTILEDGWWAIKHFGTDMGGGAFNVVSEKVPSSFSLVACANFDGYQNLHPAFRDRVQSKGAEIVLESRMDATPLNARKIARFVKQKIEYDKWDQSVIIPPFSRDAIIAICEEARRREGGKYFTLRFRNLGGIIFYAGKLAKSEGADIVTEDFVKKAIEESYTIEEQRILNQIKEGEQYSPVRISGEYIGRVNGLTVFTTTRGDMLGQVKSIESAAVRGNGKFLEKATGKLERIAKESILNSEAVVKGIFYDKRIRDYMKNVNGSDAYLENFDVHTQFLQTYGGVEGDSASIDFVTSALSSLLKVPVKQNVAMTGSITVNGEVIAVGGIPAKILAAERKGLEEVIIPSYNEDDIDKSIFNIKINPVRDIYDVLENSFAWEVDNASLRSIFKSMRREFYELNTSL